jgi:hypothetical protein
MLRQNILNLSGQYPEDEDRDGLRNVGFLTAQPFDPADSPRELHHTQSPGKQQISLHSELNCRKYFLNLICS